MLSQKMLKIMSNSTGGASCIVTFQFLNHSVRKQFMSSTMITFLQCYANKLTQQHKPVALFTFALHASLLHVCYLHTRLTEIMLQHLITEKQMTHFWGSDQGWVGTWFSQLRFDLNQNPNLLNLNLTLELSQKFLFYFRICPELKPNRKTSGQVRFG